jgi:hypothetical protein
MRVVREELGSREGLPGWKGDGSGVVGGGAKEEAPRGWSACWQGPGALSCCWCVAGAVSAAGRRRLLMAGAVGHCKGASEGCMAGAGVTVGKLVSSSCWVLSLL